MKKSINKNILSIISISLVGIISAVGLGIFFTTTKNNVSIINNNDLNNNDNIDNNIDLSFELKNNDLNRGLFIKDRGNIRINTNNTKEALEILLKDTISKTSKIQGNYNNYNLEIKHNILNEKEMKVSARIFHKKNIELKYNLNFKVLIN